MKNKFLKLMALFVASAFAVNVGAQTNGTYYLYNEASGLFLSRGGTWGTHAVAADYGISFEIVNKNSNVYTLKNIDHSLVANGGKYLGPDIYTDQGSHDYSFTASGDGYVLAKGADFLKINERNQYGQKEIGTTGTVSDAAVWELLSKEQYEVKVLEKRNANVASIAQKVGLSVATEEELVAELSEWVPQDYTSEIGNADIGGGSAAWNIDRTDANRGIGSPKSASGTFEVWKACADVNQTIEGLPQGIYKISVQAFYRHGAAANAVRVGDNYNMVVNLYANGNSTRLVSWNTIRTNNTYPNNQGDAHALLDSNASLALVEVFAYVGADGKLTLGIDNSSYVDDDWMICDNFKLTYYENIKDELKSEIEKLIDEARNIEATYGVDAKVVLDKAVADGNAALESFTVGSLTAAIEPLKAAVARAKRSVAINAAAMGATQGTPVDFTGFVTNPDMANGTIDGWTATSGWQFQQNSTYKGDGAELNKFQERWNNGTALGNTSSVQELLDMPNGVYRVSADVLATAQYNADPEGYTEGAYFVANDMKAVVATPNGTPEKYELQVTVMDGTLTIGVKGENTTANWFAFDNVMVYYYGVDLSAFIDKYNEALNLAKSYLGKLFEEDETELEQAITENTLDPSNATEAELIGATKNLESAIREAVPASAAYAIYSSAAKLIAEAGDVADVDLTSLLVNPGFEAGDVRGWTNSGTQAAGAQSNSSFDNKKENYYAERWHADGTINLNQTLSGLPAGIYKLSAYVYSDTKDAKLYANEKETGFSTSGLYSVLVEIEDKGTIKFGAACTLTNSTWICMDGFTLSYMNDLTYTLAEGKMSVAADDAQKAAAATFQAEKTLANYDAVLAAIRAAEASKVAYENLNAAIAKAEEIIANTYVYVEADKTVYQAAIDEAKAAYEAGSYDGTATMIEKLWNTKHQNPDLLARPFISSVWSDDNTVYTNNWSVEADNKANGSGMTVPFIEYWVADANSLGEKTIDAVIGGLEAGEYYELSALVRVRIKNNATEATGVTMDVNGTSVNVCDGATCDDGAPFRYGTYKVIAKVAEDGNLTVTFNVAAENTISWLSFKDVKYAKADFVPADADDYAAFNAARDAANAKVVGFLAGEYAPYNNMEVIKSLAAANAIDVAANNEKDAVQAATAAITEDKWDVNETELNAVYNGDFALCEQDGAMAGWRMSNNTLGGAYHSRAFVGDDRLKEFNETNSGAFLRFDGTNSSRGSMYFYGDTEGYTMPLKANTVYYVKVDFAGWGSTGKPLRLNVTGPEGFSAVSQEHKTSVNADKENKTPQQFYILFTTTVAGNYVINFQVPGADSNTHAVVVSNIKIYTAETATMNISDAKYSTFIAPFDVEIPEGITASKITGVEGNVLTEEAVEGIIPANTPVVLYSETPVSKTFYGQNIATAETYTAGLLTGVYNDTKVATGNYVLLRKKTTGHVGFYLVGETLHTIKANSCYLTVPASSAPMFSFGRGEGTTGIEDAELINDNVVIYDLAGRRVEKMEKGIYIVNGRKVIR